MTRDLDLSLATVFTVVFLTVYLIIRKSTEIRLPQGPRGIPVFGNALQLTSNIHNKLSQWANLYGPLYTVNIFGQKGLVISDIRLLKHAFWSLESTGKTTDDVLGVVYEETHGITNTVGLHALEQRKFFLRTLKQISSVKGSSSHESIMTNNCNQIVENIVTKLTKTDLIQVADLFHHATATTMWTVVNEDSAVDIEDNSKMTCFMNKVLKDLDIAAKSGLPMIPWLKKLGIIPPAFRQLQKSSKQMRDLIVENFEARRNTNNNSKEDVKLIGDTDILKPYINKVESCEDPTSSFFGSFGWRNCYNTMMALLLASTETTSTSLTWIIYEMVANPECQKKLQQEIDFVLGKDQPNLSHRSRMPYLQAVILETLRRCGPLPLGLWHVLLDNIQFEGYVLPKGLLLIPNIYHIHNDPALWGDPDMFRPERFLTKNNDTGELSLSSMKQNVVSFQAGRRSCPGEALAKDFMFLFSSVLFQKFNFMVDPNIKKSEFMKPTGGFILKLEATRVKIQLR